ncbi:ubiquitin--protein ligase, partial [Oesophagostomum dentatum]
LFQIKFLTKIWHPNISSQTGTICLDILKDQWAASLTLRTVLLSIQALMCSPEPKDPQDAVVAKQYMSNPALFKARDQCIVEKGEEHCGDLIEAHKKCLRDAGFEI